jgi:hypothetical protein
MAAPEPLGIFSGWGAFDDREGRKCYAIGQPFNLPDRLEPLAFASVSYWPGRGAGPQLHVRLSREKRAGSAVILRIGSRIFQLRGAGTDAWAANAAADRQIAEAMRTGLEMAVETRSTRGSRIRERYQLRGAASAIDAAAIACRPR